MKDEESGYEVKMIEHSIGAHDKEIKTFQLRYWRAIHAEVMTHRVFSRNASSSRAVPVMTMLKQIWKEPAMPIHWGKNQSGMQAKSQLTGFKLRAAKFVWRTASKIACILAYGMTKLGLHKQIANRVLEPFAFINVILTMTEDENWYDLRDHEDAQPEIQHLARMMKQVDLESTPTLLKMGEWHLPYISGSERTLNDLETLIKMSVARCARVSYLTHDKKKPLMEDDLALYNMLVGATPLHASPTEHQATPLPSATERSGNFLGFHQYRKTLEANFANW